ncbi:MAG: hypothetical protein ACJ73E_00930 [Mycobacteriales bacterium]
MTAAQPNNLGFLAGTINDDTAEALRPEDRPEDEPPPKYAGGMPDDPEQARTYRPGDDDQPDEDSS